jgi:toxin-antitoxin system PIN domain toxin
LSNSAFLFDSNIWVALTFNAHPAHRVALQMFAMTSKARPACFCRATQQSFLRLASTPAILKAYGVSGMTNHDALRTFDGFMANSAVAFRNEPASIASHWPRVAGRPTASPKVWMDAYLACFAMAGELTMVTIDDDFNAFKRHGLDLLLVAIP